MDYPGAALCPGLRSMLFVDGTNFLIELGRVLNLQSFRAETPPPNAASVALTILSTALGGLHTTPVRDFWFASITGTELDESNYKEQLRAHRFTPVIFKKIKNHREKRVDIALTTALLVNAHQKNFDVAVVVTGDADYLSVVEEAKRSGARIFGCFFNTNLNPELRIAFDRFIPIEFSTSDITTYPANLRPDAPVLAPPYIGQPLYRTTS